MAEPAFRSAPMTGDHSSPGASANQSPNPARLIMRSINRSRLSVAAAQLMNKPYQIFRVASLTMLIALAPFQGQAQPTDDIEGRHAYPPLLQELGIPLLNRARVIDIESAFTSERGGRLVIATRKASPDIRRFFEETLPEADWTIAETQAVTTMRQQGLIDNLPLVAIFTRPTWLLHIRAERFADERHVTLTLSRR